MNGEIIIDVELLREGRFKGRWIAFARRDDEVTPTSLIGVGMHLGPALASRQAAQALYGLESSAPRRVSSGGV